MSVILGVQQRSYDPAGFKSTARQSNPQRRLKNATAPGRGTRGADGAALAWAFGFGFAGATRAVRVVTPPDQANKLTKESRNIEKI
jgi:hypothetical protein